MYDHQKHVMTLGKPILDHLANTHWIYTLRQIILENKRKILSESFAFITGWKQNYRLNQYNYAKPRLRPTPYSPSHCVWTLALVEKVPIGSPCVRRQSALCAYIRNPRKSPPSMLTATMYPLRHWVGIGEYTCSDLCHVNVHDGLCLEHISCDSNFIKRLQTEWNT